MLKKCPKCGLTNHDAANLCDCGYNFETGKTTTLTQGEGANPVASVLKWL